MNKLVIYVLIGSLLVSCVLAADEASAGKHDFVQLIENTDHCFDCYTVYKITKADDVSLSRLGVDFKDAKGDFVIPDYELTYLQTETYVETIDKFVPCSGSMTVHDNDTGEEKTVEYESSCYDSSEEVEKTRSFYVPVSFDDIKMAFAEVNVGDSFYIKISGRLNKDETVDNILVLNDFVYDEYAWWNASFQYRLNISCSNVTDGLPIVINGSNGFKINSSTQVVWTNCLNSTGLAVYFNNYSDYVVADDTSQRPFEVESGNGASYLPVQVWSDGYVGVYHLNGSAKDSSGHVNGTIMSGVTISSVNCIVGKCYNFTPTASQGRIDLGDAFDGYTSMSVEAWVYADNISTYGNVVNNAESGAVQSWGLVDGSVSAGGFCFLIYNGSTTRYVPDPYDEPLKANTTYFLAGEYSGSVLSRYRNGTLNGTTVASGVLDDIAAHTYIGGNAQTTVNTMFDGIIDEVRISNKNRSVSYYSAVYNNMIGTSGYGTLGHEETNWMYITPANESSGREAVLTGVNASGIAGAYTPYYDKQVYERLANGSQYKGTFDVFVVSGNKRWAFNYDQNTSSGFPVFFNITPVFYVWQKYNLTYYQIMADVQAFIDSTN